MAAHDHEPGLREHSMGELFKELSDDMSVLVRQELRLARAELTEKGKHAGVGLGMFGGAGLFGLLAAGTLTACVIAAFSTQMKVWIAALIVTVAYGAVAMALGLQGKHKVAEATPPVPEQTVETVKEDVQWAKTQMSSGSK